MIDKNQAIIEYLLRCPAISGSPLYFNFVNEEDDSRQVVTTSNDVLINRPYIDGSVSKRYTFTIIEFKSVTNNAVVSSIATYNENVEELADVQALIDWIEEQNDLQNFPDFGSTCQIDSIHSTTENPSLDGINTNTMPMLATYSVSIQIDYLDVSKVIWN